MNLKYLTIIITGLLVIYSCTKKDTGLTDEEIVQGLKDALTVGTDTSITKVSKKDGYYGDLTIKILLPPQSDQIVQYKDDVPGLSSLVDSMVLALNRASEDAAIEAKPIFLDAITSMTITDAVNILHGSDTAATNYLRQTTYSSLTSTFEPKIDISLNKPIIGFSANTLWNRTTGLWNSFATSNCRSFTRSKPRKYHSL